MNEQQRLLRRIRSAQFAMWELRIFLVTHPNDCGALKRLNEYKKQTQSLIDQYEEAYGPLNEDSATANRWAWVQEPWPWEIQAEKEES